MASKDIVKNFAENTTMHGLGRFVESSSKRRRIIWGVLIVVCISVFIWQFQLLIERFFSYPKKTVLEISREAVHFPDITVCNMRNMDISKILSLSLKLKQSPTSNPAEIMHLADKGFETEYFKFNSMYYPGWVKNRVKEASLYQELFSRTNQIANLPFDAIKEASIPEWEFKITCQWGRENCKEENITALFLPYFFTCLTFHAPSESLVTEGIENGWSSTILAGNNIVNWTGLMGEDTTRTMRLPGVQEFGHPLSGNEGVRVVIHAPGTKPFPLVEGFNIPPGHSASLGVVMWKNALLNKPHGNCQELDLNAKTKYSILFCFRECMQRYVIQQCDCKDVSLPDDPDVEYCAKVTPHPPPLYCQSLTTVNDSCLDPLWRMYDRLQCVKKAKDFFSRSPDLMNDCKCYPPCNSAQYQVTFSLTKWPAGPEMDLVYSDIFKVNRFYEKLQAENPTPLKAQLYSNYFNLQNRHKAMQDFVKLNVYIADTTVVKTTEVPDYSPLQLVSDMGGQLGLWVGMSVLTIAEIFQLVLDVFYAFKNLGTKVEKIQVKSRNPDEDEMPGKKSFTDNYM